MQNPSGAIFEYSVLGLFPIDAVDTSTPLLPARPQTRFRELSHDGGVYATAGSELVKITPNGETVMATIRPSATPPREVLAPAWHAESRTAYFSGTLDGKSGVIQLRTGQPPRLLTEMAASAVVVAADGRVFAKSGLDLVEVFADGTVKPLLGVDGPLRTSPSDLGQNIAAGSGGLIYRIVGRGRVDLWEERTRAVVPIYVEAPILFLTTLADGSVAAWTFNEGFRKINGSTLDNPALNAPILSARWMTPAGYGVSSNGRLVRLRQSSAEWITLEELATPNFLGSAFMQVEAVTPIPNGALVRLTGGQFSGVMQIDGIDGCKRKSLPFIATDGVTATAGSGFPDSVSSYQLFTLFGNNLGSKQGSEMLFDRFGSVTAANSEGVEVLSAEPGPSHHVFSTGTQFTVTTFQQLDRSLFGGLLPPRFSWQSDGIRWTHPKPLRPLAATPGLFITGGLRDGPAACLNQDGSINSATNPATPGSVVQFYAGGLGNVDPEPDYPADFFSKTIPHRAKNPVSIQIGGRPAEILFAGGAPGQLVGVYQVNAKIPEGLPSGPATVDLTVAGQSTTRFQKVTVFVK